MKEWLIGLFCLIIIFNIILTIFSKRKISNILKIIFGIIFLVYSIKPIVYLDFDNIVNNYEVNLSTFSAENNLANQIIEESSKNCDKIIKNLGISGAKVVIEYTVENESFVKIKKVKINLKNCSYNGNINHKDIQRKLKNCLSISLNISEDDIVLSE